MLRAYLGEIRFQRPERSGWPSGARGAGAARFGLPSGVRGTPGVGRFSHCAAKGAANAPASAAMRQAFIVATSFQATIYTPISFQTTGEGAAHGRYRETGPQGGVAREWARRRTS